MTPGQLVGALVVVWAVPIAAVVAKVLLGEWRSSRQA